MGTKKGMRRKTARRAYLGRTTKESPRKNRQIFNLDDVNKSTWFHDWIGLRDIRRKKWGEINGSR